MTISSSTNRSDYAGNGSTTAFATGFKFFTNSDLSVILVTDSTGAEAVQVITTNYSVAGAGVSAGGTVTMVVAPATGETLVMIRAQPYTQSLDLVENDGFPSDSVEETLDKTVIMTQQLLDAMGRTLRQPGGDTTAIAEMPAKVTRASAFLAFNAAGDPIASAGTDTSVPISAFMATVVDDATAAAARATLGAVIGTDVQAHDAQLADIAAIVPVSGDILYVDGSANIVKLAKGTDTNVLTQASGFPSWAAPATAALNDILLYQDQATSGTISPTYTTGGWRTVIIDTEVVDTAAIGSLASNQITLPAGSYEFTGFVQTGYASATNARYRARLYNATDAAVIVQGLTQSQPGSGFFSQSLPIIGQFTLAGTKALELQVNTSASTTGSPAAATGEVEIWASIQFRRYA